MLYINFTFPIGEPGWGSGYPKGSQADLEITLEEKETVSPHLSTDLQELLIATKLSISGNIWRPDKSDIFSGGQNSEEIKKLFPGNEMVQKIIRIWERWHLNDLKSGTNKQDEILNQYKEDNPDWRYSYTEACDILKRNDLYIDRDYKYGYAWLTEELPQEVIDFITSLASVTSGAFIENKES